MMGKITSLGRNFLKCKSRSFEKFLLAPNSIILILLFDFLVTVRKEEKPVTNPFNDIEIMVLILYSGKEVTHALFTETFICGEHISLFF